MSNKTQKNPADTHLALADPPLGLGTQHLNLVLLDGHTAVIQRRLPAQLAALSRDVGHLQWALRPSGTAEHDKFDPLFVIAEINQVLLFQLNTQRE